MNKDQIAIYLNEHPEFFNDYPELLHKIKSIDVDDLPIEPLSTLSIADRILKRAHDDKEHLKSKLEWFIELAQANEQIQDHLYEIERLILKSTKMDEMVRQFRRELTQRFEIHDVQVCFVDGSDRFIEDRFQEKFPKGVNETMRFVDSETADGWFEKGLQPVLKGEVNGDSVFNMSRDNGKIKSEALIPIISGDTLAGAIILGSTKPHHFYEGLRTEFLERMAEKLAISMENILLIERLKRLHPHSAKAV